MKKRGELLAPETLKIIISIICILVLVYLLFAIYNSSSNKQELLKAKELIAKISGIITHIGLGGQYVGEPVYKLVPDSWELISYVGQKAKPNQCTGQNCLCICDPVSSWLSILKSTEERQLNECSKNGVCTVIKNLKDFGVIKIESAGATNINISKAGEFIEIKKI